MPKKTYYALAAALAATMQVACVAKPAPVSCTFDGEKHLPAGMNSAQLCSSFNARLAQALAQQGSEAKAKDIVVALNLSPRGTIEAKVVQGGGNSAEKLPIAAVDVMDRNINNQDFDRLAETLAQILTK